jgi:hypothetical protein
MRRFIAVFASYFSIGKPMIPARHQYKRARAARKPTDTTMEKILQLFKEHPDSVGEGYFEHMAASFSFAVPLLSAAIAAFIHGLLPFCFVRTGSRIVTRLHERMVLHRAGKQARQ